MMNVVCLYRPCDGRIQSVWRLEWRLGAQGALQSISFFTEAEAVAAFNAVCECCHARGISPSDLPRAAIVIMLDALSQGREPVAFVTAGCITKRALH